MRLIPKKKLIDFGINLLTHWSVPQGNARYISQVAVETEAMGIHTHGLAVLLYYENVIPDELNPKAEPILIKDRGASALIDGNDGFGELAMKLAKELAETKAKSHGVAMIAVRNVYWLGAIGVYLTSLVEKGFLAQLCAQTSTCTDCAPFGGIDPKFSTNPVAFAFPTGGDPMISDFSTASMSMGKAKRMAKSGAKAEEAVCMDKNGKLSDEPKVINEGGSLLFFGGAHYGYKGYGMSLWNEALTAVAGGDCNNPGVKTRQSFNLTVVDPELFAGRNYYSKEMKRFIAHMKQSRVLPGFNGIRLPGEKKFQNLRESEAHGVKVEESMVDRLNQIARNNEIPLLSEFSPG